MVEEQLAEQMQRIELSDDLIDAMIERVHEVFAKKHSLFERQKSILLRRRTLAEQKRDAVEQKLLAGVVSDEAFERLMPQITKELDETNRELGDLDSTRRLDTNVLREVLQVAKNIPATYTRAEPRMQRRYLAFFFQAFVMRDRQIVRAVPSEFFQTLLEFRRVRTSGNWSG